MQYAMSSIYPQRLLALFFRASYHLNNCSNMKNNELKKEISNKKAILACALEFSMIGDPTRLKICYLLCRHGELSVSDIADIVGVSVSAVSHTLRKLREAGMTENRREFRMVYYKLKRTRLTDILKMRLSARGFK